MDPNFKKLSSADPKVISEGIKEIAQQVEKGADPKDLPLMFDALTSLFYIDTFDRPDLRKTVTEAQRTVAKMGPAVIPLIMEKVRDTDIKAELALAQTCGLMGEAAIAPLIAVFNGRRDPVNTAFALYALGKIKSPKIKAALPIILKAVKSPRKETEDTAVRALGKICESMNPADLDEETKNEIFESLISKCAHSNAVIRSKAVRSLGKLIRYGFANDVQRNTIIARAKSILGLDEDHELDPAYLVRREAQEILDSF
ncbi:MAG: HEAT repeat domain-containing protein [FCB group bacterium]|nr:HEAT repeat domain-containing protein [FCB group bacterium]